MEESRFGGLLSNRDLDLEQALENAVIDATLQAELNAAIEELRTGRKPELIEVTEDEMSLQRLLPRPS